MLSALSEKLIISLTLPVPFIVAEKRRNLRSFLLRKMYQTVMTITWATVRSIPGGMNKARIVFDCSNDVRPPSHSDLSIRSVDPQNVDCRISADRVTATRLTSVFKSQKLIERIAREESLFGVLDPITPEGS